MDEEARRLLWRCRRGMKELDVLLERYVRSSLQAANAQERETFTQLLELPDPLLADYLFGHATAPEPRMAGLVQAIVRAATTPPPERDALVGEYR